MKIKYNSPVILTYALISIAVLLFAPRSLIYGWFSSPSAMLWTNPEFYIRLVTYIAGHGNWEHLTSNFMMILLVGPLLEEKYGSPGLFEVMLITAVSTAILNLLLFSSGIIGSSGIAFMLILLGSFANIKAGEIPITFIIISALFLGNEVLSGLRSDNISQFSHLAGGCIGGIYGFLRRK